MNTVNRAIPPEIRPSEPFSLPKPRLSKLPNGIPVFYFDNPNLDLIHILLQVKTGALYQPQKHLCNFAYSLLKESSPRLSPEEVSEKLDYFGTNLTVNVGMDNVQIMFSVPKNNLGRILPVISAFLISPMYRENNLSIFQDKEVKNLAYNEQKTDYCAWRIMWREMLGETFPAVSEFATTTSIRSVTTQALQDFHKYSFCAENLTVFVTGNTDMESEKLIEDAWMPVPHGIPAPELPETPSPESHGKLFYQPKENCMQSSIVLCSPSMSFNEPERTAFSVLNTLTGGYFSSRLMQNLRERQGLTYGISSSSTFFGRQSVFAISSEVNADNTRLAMDACFEELQRLQNEHVSDDELNMVKNYMAGIQLRAADTSVSAMLKFAYWRRFGLDETEMFRYLSEIKNVTPDDIIFLAKKHFSYNKFTRIIVGLYS
jgi:predicted Zn-dependent peptidase